MRQRELANAENNTSRGPTYVHAPRNVEENHRVVRRDLLSVIWSERRRQDLLRVALGGVLDVALVGRIEVLVMEGMLASYCNGSKKSRLPLAGARQLEPYDLSPWSSENGCQRRSGRGKAGKCKRRTSEMKSGFIRTVEIPSRWLRTQ